MNHLFECLVKKIKEWDLATFLSLFRNIIPWDVKSKFGWTKKEAVHDYIHLGTNDLCWISFLWEEQQFASGH